MTTTRQPRTWPYDLLKAIIALILLGLMLYFRPDMGAVIQKQLGLPFGTITVLDTPHVTSSSPTTTLSGRTQSGATVDVFAGDTKLGTTTAGENGTWSLPVTLPDGNYQLRAQARDAAGADLGAPAVLTWNSQQLAAQSDAQVSEEDSTQFTEPDAEAAAAGTESSTDSGEEASTNATAESSPSDPSAASGAIAAGASASTAPSLEAAQVSTDSVTLSGSGQPGTTVEVVSSDGAVATATVGQDGAWTLLAQLAPGEHELQARSIDASGAQAGASPVLTVIVPDTASAAEAGTADTTTANVVAATADASAAAPAQASVDAVPAGRTQDTAQAAAEGATVTVPQMDSPVLSGNKAMLSGTAAPGAMVEIVSNDKLLGRAVADADGSWAAAAQLKPGFHALQVRTRDAARTQVQASPVVSLTVPVAAGPTVAATGEFTATEPAEPVGTGALTATSSGTTAGTALAMSTTVTGTSPATNSTTITDVSAAEATTSARPTTLTTPTPAPGNATAFPTRSSTATVTAPTAVDSVAAAAIVSPTAASPAGSSTVENAAAPAIRSTAATTPALSQPTPVATPAEANQAPSQDVTVTGGDTGGESDNSGGKAVVIQTGDSLSALAQEYLGDQARYTEIVAATNEMAKQDPSFGTITDPDLITLGQKIWIPAQ